MRIGVLTDFHVVPDSGREVAWHNRYDFAGLEARLARAAELFREDGAELVLVLGDLAHDGDEPSLRRALAPLTGGLAPLVAVGGNHDGPRPTAAFAELAIDGLELPGWRARRASAAVRVAGVRVLRRARGEWALARPPALATWGEGPVLLATHFPVLSRAVPVHAAELPYAGDLIDRERLAAALLDRPEPTIAVCGHMHVREGTAEGPLLQLACCALVEPPFEANILDVETNGGELRATRTAHELPGATPMERDPRLGPARERWTFSPGRGWRRSRR
jgi:predicted phosphodiesterase